jgi:hypothetical protein
MLLIDTSTVEIGNCLLCSISVGALLLISLAIEHIFNAIDFICSIIERIVYVQIAMKQTTGMMN